MAGLAVAGGLIRNLDDPVCDEKLDDAFDSAHNRTITWRHLLQQTSEWQGTMWGKPDTIDHHRDLGQSELGRADKGRARPLKPPGTFWEYNDVRVNRLSLCLLQLFRRPPDVLREAVMDPIGASVDWAWQPYDNSWIECDGRRLPSVPGGSHWGGGLWMSSFDHARLELLVQRQGAWGQRCLLDPAWLVESRTPGPVNPQYGLLWWLNTACAQFPGAPATAYAARGAGSNAIVIDPEHDLLAVVRWIDRASLPEFVRLLMASVAID